MTDPLVTSHQGWGTGANIISISVDIKFKWFITFFLESKQHNIVFLNVVEIASLTKKWPTSEVSERFLK